MEERLVIKTMEEAVQNIDFIMGNYCQGERYEASKMQKLREIEGLLKQSPNGVEIRRFTPFEKVPESETLILEDRTGDPEYENAMRDIAEAAKEGKLFEPIKMAMQAMHPDKNIEEEMLRVKAEYERKKKLVAEARLMADAAEYCATHDLCEEANGEKCPRLDECSGPMGTSITDKEYARVLRALADELEQD